MLYWLTLGLILLGVALAATYRGSRQSNRPAAPPIREKRQILSTVPTLSPTGDFRYYPGAPKGYAGYTDHVAMKHTLNAALLDLPPDLQFPLIGFARGFLVGILARAGEGEEGRQLLFRTAFPSDEDRKRLEWIAHMQESGTDNAGPSTHNMSDALYSVVQDLRSTGPYRHGYWDKALDGAKESLTDSGISHERLTELVEMMEREQKHGEQLAAGASRVAA
jgi:hypothetical protein